MKNGNQRPQHSKMSDTYIAGPRLATYYYWVNLKYNFLIGELFEKMNALIR